MHLAQIGIPFYQMAKRLRAKANSQLFYSKLLGAVLDNLKMGYEKDNEEEPLKSL